MDYFVTQDDNEKQIFFTYERFLTMQDLKIHNSSNALKDFIKTTEGHLEEEISISTGKNIIQASDDPIGAVELSGLEQVSERFNQYSRNANNAINRLTIADNALVGITNLMMRAKEISIQAANDTF